MDCLKYAFSVLSVYKEQIVKQIEGPCSDMYGKATSTTELILYFADLQLMCHIATSSLTGLCNI